jgi:hypothetical protein
LRLVGVPARDGRRNFSSNASASDHDRPFAPAIRLILRLGVPFTLSPLSPKGALHTTLISNATSPDPLSDKAQSELGKVKVAARSAPLHSAACAASAVGAVRAANEIVSVCVLSRAVHLGAADAGTQCLSDI